MPSPAGCFGDDFYTHDAQCVVYRGPDRDHQGREICFNANTDTLTIVDVSDKAAPVMLSRTRYEGSSYARQGWLTEDHAHFLLGDELDELRRGQRTRTFVWDVGDLDAPALNGFHESESAATDHNLYVRGNHVFQANYRSGVRILRLGDLAVSELAEVAFSDTDPDSDAPSSLGIWGTYPWLESGVLIASDRRRGLFVLRPDLEAVPECWDGIDNDGDGRRDHPDDTTCLRPESPYEDRRVDVRIAVAPYGREGVIRLDARRPVAVLIRGSRTVDVRQVDVEGLRFGPAAAPPRLHPGRSGWPRRLRFRPRDVDGDGHPDLLMHFGAAALGLFGLVWWRRRRRQAAPPS